MTDSDDNHFDLFNDEIDIIPRDVVAAIIQPTATSIDEFDFAECSSLISINIPNLVTNIGEYTFAECSSLVSISIPSSVTSIGDSAFWKCSSLTTIRIPSSVVSIKESTFHACSSLTSIDIPSSVTIIGDNAFFECSSLMSITIPSSVVRIGEGAFGYCHSLILIVIPESVTEIGDDAFSNCNVLELRLVNGYNYNVGIQTWLRWRFLNLPLHQAFYHSSNTMTTSLLNNLIHQHSSMINSTDTMLMTPLHVLCCSPTVTADMLQILKVASPVAASRRNVLGETPLMMYLKCKNTEYNAYHTVSGHLLPLVELIEFGLKSYILKIILIFYDLVKFSSELEERNKSSGLLPFMYCASLSQCGLDTVYEVAMKRPNLLIQSDYTVLEPKKESSKKRNRSNSTLSSEE
jgi:hypothetical protein